MEDATSAGAPQVLWIHLTAKILSFHQEDGFEQLIFPDNQARMNYVFDKTSSGFRIQ